MASIFVGHIGREGVFNINKLLVSWFSIYVVCALLQAIFGSGGGLVATTLTAALSKTEIATIHVNNTQGYRSGNATLYIENEMIFYTGKTANTFTGLTRAYNQTSASAHSKIGTPVYSQEMGTVNQASGFTIAQTETTGGSGSAAGFNLDFLVRAIPQVVLWNFSFLQGQLVYLRILLQAVGIGLTVTIIFAGIYTFMSIFKR